MYKTLDDVIASFEQKKQSIEGDIRLCKYFEDNAEDALERKFEHKKGERLSERLNDFIFVLSLLEELKQRRHLDE